MYNIAKYKQYFKLKFFLTRFSSPRILKFKATKWKTVHDYIRKTHGDIVLVTKKVNKQEINIQNAKNVENLQKPKEIFEYGVLFVEPTIISLTRYYHEGLILKRSIFEYYNKAISQVYFKKLLRKNLSSFKAVLGSVLIAPFFKLEILLWVLGIFKSIRQIRELFNTNKIFVNEKCVSSGFLLKEGDIISFKGIDIKLVECVRVRFYTFIELDFFSNKIVVLKDYKTMSEVDFTLLLPDVAFDIAKFLNFIRK